jgi:hypothetical protein
MLSGGDEPERDGRIALERLEDITVVGVINLYENPTFQLGRFSHERPRLPQMSRMDPWRGCLARTNLLLSFVARLLCRRPRSAAKLS